MKFLLAIAVQFPIFFLKAKELWQKEIKDKNFFIADRILAKHDEKYMPPELKGLFKKNVK